jgi:hypothetical protein
MAWSWLGKFLWAGPLEPQQRVKTVIGGVLLTAVVASVDWLTGFEVGFFVFYFVPIVYVAWFSGTVRGLLFALVAAVVWMAVDVLSGNDHLASLILFWNTLIRLISFLLMAWGAGQIRVLIDRERLLSKELQVTLDQVRELRGLLPICASCKKIRNDTGYWEHIEEYIRAHSRAEFSHGICPACYKRLYPEIWERKHGNPGGGEGPVD